MDALASPGLSQSTGGVPGAVLVPALSCPRLSTHQQCPVEPWHLNTQQQIYYETAKILLYEPTEGLELPAERCTLQ